MGKIAAIVLATGLPALPSYAAVASPTDAGSVLTRAPDMRASDSPLQISQALPPVGALTAAPAAIPGLAGDNSRALPQNWRIELGLGVAAGPKYPGSGQIAAVPLPLVSVTYNERFFVSSRQGIGAYVIRTPNFRLGASIGIAADTRYTGNDARLRGLPKIKPGGLASLFAAYELGPVAVEAAVRERIGRTNGVSATLGATYRISLTSDWSVTAGPELRVLSAKLNDAFFGVTPAASLNAASYGNKISPYRPGTGFEVVPVTIVSQYHVSEHWTVLARAGLGVLVGRDGDSPLTRQRVQPEVGLLVTYRF